MENFRPKKLIISMAIITVLCIFSFVIGALLIGFGAVDFVDSGKLTEVIDDLDLGDVGDVIADIADGNIGLTHISCLPAGKLTVATNGVAVSESVEENRITLSGIVCNVVLKASEDGTFSAEFDGKVSENIADEELLSIENGKLTMPALEGFGNKRAEGTLTVYIPADVDLQLEATVGKVETSGTVTVKELSIHGNVAKIDLSSIKAGAVSLEGCLGSVSIDGSFTSILVDGCMGGVEAKSDTRPENDCCIKGNMGKVNIKLPASSLCDFDTDGNMGKVSTPKSNTGGVDFEIEGNMGTVNVEY